MCPPITAKASKPKKCKGYLATKKKLEDANNICDLLIIASELRELLEYADAKIKCLEANKKKLIEYAKPRRKK